MKAKSNDGSFCNRPGLRPVKNESFKREVCQKFILMRKTFPLVIITTLLVIAACNHSKKATDNVQELIKGYQFSIENGWHLPDKAVLLTNEQVLKLSQEDEVDLSMNDYYLLAMKPIKDDVKVVLWAKNNIADTQEGGVAYLSLTDTNGKAIETIEVVNSYESENGRFFDVFYFDADNRFTKSRMVKGNEGTDVVFRYEYQINEKGTFDLQVEFVNRSAIEEIAAENTKREFTIFDGGLTFLPIGESFAAYATYIPQRFEVSEESPGYSYELKENGEKVISFLLVNNLIEEIRIYSEAFTTENNIGVGNTFSQLKSAYNIETIECRADEGIWGKVKGNPRIEFQLDVPKNIPCNSDDEMPVSSVPGNTKITCVRVVAL